jgi:fucose permease
LYLLLAVLFFLSIGDGIANALLGSAWPAISAEIRVPISYQSIMIPVYYAGTILGALTAEKLMELFRNYLPELGRAILILVAILLFSFADTFAAMIALVVFVGYAVALGQVLLDGYVARRYSAAAMSCLQACFGLGGMIAPLFLAYGIGTHGSWRRGCQIAVGAAALIVVITLASMPLWRIHAPILPARLSKFLLHGVGAAPGAATQDTAHDDAGAQDTAHDVGAQDTAHDAGAQDTAHDAGAHHEKAKPLRELFRLPGTRLILVNVVFFTSLEVTIFFWCTSFLVEAKGFTAAAAASYMTYFYGAQVAGRILSGLAALKLSDSRIIRVSQLILLICLICFLFTPVSALPLMLVLIGVFTGPIFPNLIHEVPSIVGKAYSQGVIGLQNAAANVGNALIPMGIGLVCGRVGFGVYPYFLLALITCSIIFKFILDARRKQYV